MTDMTVITYNRFLEVLKIVPSTDWCNNWNPGSTLLLRQTSKKVRDVIDMIQPPIEVVVNMNYWNDFRNGTAAEKIEYISSKVIGLASLALPVSHASHTWRISRIVLPCDMNVQLKRFKEVLLISQCKNIPNLNLYKNNVNATNITSILDALGQCVFLNLANNNLYTEGTKSLVNVLTKCSSLNLEANNIGTAGLKYIENCKTLTTLTHLNIDCNEIHAINIDKILCQNAGMTYLNISHNTPLTINYDIEQIQRKQFALTNLDLTNCHIGTIGVTSLVGVLAQCPVLTTLNLITNNIGSADFECIADCKTLTTLTHLNIGDNQINVINIDKILCKNTSLTYLDIRQNRISAINYDIAQIQNSSFALTYLDIAYCHFGAAGATSLAGVLKQCPVLAHLNLAYNNIGVEGGYMIGEVIGHCTSLHKLYLTGNGIGETGIEGIVTELSHCPNIKHLPLCGNDIGKECRNRIMEMLGHRDYSVYIG